MPADSSSSSSLRRSCAGNSDVEVTLVDKNPTHIWKPLFHEVATGSLNSYHDEASYRMLARKHGFQFVLGRVTDVDPDGKSLQVSGFEDDVGDAVVPERTVGYDMLVVAVGSLSNDFGIEGVVEHSRGAGTRARRPSASTSCSRTSCTGSIRAPTTTGSCRSSSSAAAPPAWSSPPTCTASCGGCASTASRSCRSTG